MTVVELNALAVAEARLAFERCCGCASWAERMVARRPFADQTQLLGIARDHWEALTPEQWREAFAHHPRIGDLASLGRRFGASADLAAREQSAAASASRATLEALAEGNRAYEERFGYIFIVFASGRSADEMLAMLRERLGNAPDAELAIAAGEQWKIMRLRLERLLDEPS